MNISNVVSNDLSFPHIPGKDYDSRETFSRKRKQCVNVYTWEHVILIIMCLEQLWNSSFFTNTLLIPYYTNMWCESESEIY